MYPVRPPACVGWHCGWRMLSVLDQSWRPDRSGVMIKLYSSEDGRLQVCMLLTDGPAPLSRKQFASAVANFVARDADVYLQVPGPIGSYPAQALLNPHVKAAAEARVLEAMQFQLKSVYKALLQHKFEDDGLVMRTSLADRI